MSTAEITVTNILSLVPRVVCNTCNASYPDVHPVILSSIKPIKPIGPSCDGCFEPHPLISRYGDLWDSGRRLGPVEYVATLAAKAKLIGEYARKPVRSFHQYNCFINVEYGDDIIIPDGDGHCVFDGWTEELRATGPDMIRVTIHEDVTREDALAALRKIIDSIESEKPKRF